jgi:hypothetical protein
MEPGHGRQPRGERASSLRALLARGPGSHPVRQAFLEPIFATDFTGIGVIPFGWDVLVVAAFSLVIYFYAISVCLTPEEVRSHIEDARAEAEEEEELAV